MAVENISMSLRVWHQDGKRLPKGAFIENLSIHSSDPVKHLRGPGVLRVQLLSLTMEDFQDEDEPSEALAAAVKDSLLKAAKWFAKQDSAIFRSLREAGFVTDVFVGAWIESGKKRVRGRKGKKRREEKGTFIFSLAA